MALSSGHPMPNSLRVTTLAQSPLNGRTNGTSASSRATSSSVRSCLVMKSARTRNANSFSEPSRLRLRVRPTLIGDIDDRSCSTAAVGTPKPISVSETAFGKASVSRSASRAGSRTGSRDRSLMNSRTCRRPKRISVPYQSPSRVVDSADVSSSSSGYFKRIRSRSVQRRTNILTCTVSPQRIRRKRALSSLISRSQSRKLNDGEGEP